MSLESELAGLTTAIRNATEVLVAIAAKGLPTATFAPTPPPEPTQVPPIRWMTNLPAPRISREEMEKCLIRLPDPAPEATKAEVAPTPEPEATKTEVAPQPATAPEPAPAPAPVPEAPAAKPISEEDLRLQIVDLARPKMADSEFKKFLVGKLAGLQGSHCSITGNGQLPKIDACHLPALLAAVQEKLN